MKHLTLFFVIVASLMWGGVPVGLAETPSARVALERPAPAFTLTLLSGKKVQLADFLGKVLVLNFWHSG
jgi:cytochrome oxidase Cu insertion factor (SCO1/SenC/PrrC family)